MTPESEVRELAARAIRDACPGEGACVADEEECFRLHPIHELASVDGVMVSVVGDVLALADAVLAAVEPVIRRQERAEVAEEIARAVSEAPREQLLDIPAMRLPPLGHTGWVARQVRDLVAASAAAIARSHSTQEEQDHD